MTTPTRRPAATLVIAVAAFAIAFLSSPLPGEAAGLIKTRQIANGAISTAKIKNNAVTTAKIRNDAVNSAKVRNGSLTTADLAPGVRPTAYWADAPGNEPVLGAYTTIVTVSVPAGSYAVSASASLTNITGASRSAYCRIFDGVNGYGVLRPFDASDQKTNDVTVTAVVKRTTPGPLSLQCYVNIASSVYTASGSRPQVMAVSVGAVVNQTP